jgi:hypothetical protein
MVSFKNISPIPPILLKIDSYVAVNYNELEISLPLPTFWQ